MTFLSEQALKHLLDTRDDDVIDLTDDIVELTNGIVLAKTLAKWRVCRGLKLKATSELPLTMLTIPRWSGTLPHRTFSDFVAWGNKQTTAVNARATGITWESPAFYDHSVGILAKGLNLNRFTNGYWRGNMTGILAEYDELIGAGGVGNDNRFMSCDFRGNTVGVRTVANADTAPGGSAGNNWQFTGAVFENNQTSVDLAVGLYWSFSGGRVESVNGERGVVLGAKTQLARFRDTILTGVDALVIGEGARNTKLRDCIVGRPESIKDDSDSTTYEGCYGIPDTRSVYAEMSDVANKTPTVVPQTWGSYARLQWRPTLGHAVGFSSSEPGVLRYDGKQPARFVVSAALSVVADENLQAAFRLALNDGSLAQSQRVASLEADDTDGIQLQDIVLLQPGNTLSIQVTRGAGVNPTLLLKAGHLTVRRID